MKKIGVLILLIVVILGCEKTKFPQPTNIEKKPIFIFDDISVMEGDSGIVEVIISLVGKHSKEIIVPFTTKALTAESSYDFQPLDGALVFLGGDSTESRSIFLEILDDEIFEDEEQFSLLFDIDTTVIFTEDELTISINDNDVEFTDNDLPGYVTKRNKDGWDLMWSDEFSGEFVNTTDWIQADKGNWFNNELQYYTPDNSTVSDGLLTITARPEVKEGHPFTSSRLWSQHKVHYKYGQIDIRAKLPYSKGLWPAFWMMGENRDVVGWPECGEIDIMELRGHIPNTISSTVHYKNSAGQHQFPQSTKYSLGATSFNMQFHVFSMRWNEYKVEFFVDEDKYNTIFFSSLNFHNSGNPFLKEFYILMNVAVGGNFGGDPDNTTIWPQTMNVDYVRIYKVK